MKEKYFYNTIVMSRKVLNLGQLDPNRVASLSASRAIPAAMRMGEKSMFIEFIVPEEAFLQKKYRKCLQQMIQFSLAKISSICDIELYGQSL